MPLFKYLFKSVQYEYINQYFKRKDLHLSPALTELFTRYYQVVYSRQSCGHLSINTLLTLGGYCNYPAIDKSTLLFFCFFMLIYTYSEIKLGLVILFINLNLILYLNLNLDLTLYLNVTLSLNLNLYLYLNINLTKT